MTPQSAFVTNFAVRELKPRSFAVRRCKCVSQTTMELQVGQRVRVAKSVIMYHYPSKRNQPVDIAGFEGVVAKDVSHYDGVLVSATAPYIVDFSESHSRFRAHLQEDELEAL